MDDIDEYEHLQAVLESFRAIRRRAQARAAADTPAAPETADPEEEAGAEDSSPTETTPPELHRQPTMPSIKLELI